MDTVTVACKLPNGLVMHLVGPDGVKQEVTVKGGRLPINAKTGHEVHAFEIADSFGLTPGVPADFWAQWAANNAEYPPVKRGLIFASGDVSDVRAVAREMQAVTTGYDPLDPDKPGAGLEQRKDN